MTWRSRRLISSSSPTTDHFRQVVEQAAVKVVAPAPRAGADLDGDEPAEQPDDKQMAEHGRGRQALHLRPALLELELPDEADERAEALVGGLGQQFFDEREVAVLFDLAHDLGFRLLDAVERLAPVVDEAELPSRGDVVRGAEDAVFERFVHAIEVFAALFAQTAGDGRQKRLELAEHPGVELFLLFPVGHQAVEDRRLDVGDEHAVQKAERAVADQAVPVDRPAAVFLGAGDEPGDHRLVRLLVELGELRRAGMVVPAFDAGGRKNQFHQCFRDHLRAFFLVWLFVKVIRRFATPDFDAAPRLA